MAETVTWDTIEGASLEIRGLTVKRVRTGVISGMNVDPVADPTVLERALSILGVTLGVSNCPGWDYLPLAALRIVGFTSDGVRFELSYESPSGLVPTAYVVTHDSCTVSYRTQCIPGTRNRLLVAGWQDPDNDANFVPDGIATLDVDRQHLIVNVAVVQVGNSVTLPGTDPSNPADTPANYTGYLNSDTWQGFASGFWKLKRWATSTSVYGGYTTINAQAECRVIEDWSEIRFLTSQVTGLPIPYAQSDLDALNALPYQFGDFDPSGTYQGLGRWGLNKTTNFRSIFGFS